MSQIHLNYSGRSSHSFRLHLISYRHELCKNINHEKVIFLIAKVFLMLAVLITPAAAQQNSSETSKGSSATRIFTNDD